MKKPLRVSRAALATLLGVSERTARRLERDGILVPVAPPKRGKVSFFDVAINVAAYIKHVLAERESTSPRDRKDLAQARLSELRYEREAKTLVPADEVVAEFRGHVLAARARLLQVPAAARLRGLAEDHVRMLESLIREALAELAGEAPQ